MYSCMGIGPKLVKSLTRKGIAILRRMKKVIRNTIEEPVSRPIIYVLKQGKQC